VAPLRPASTPPADPPPAAVAPVPTIPVEPPAPRPRPRPTKPAPLVAGEPTDIDHASAQRLRRGRLTIEARLDLHGMNRDQAREAVDRFVAASIHLGRRHVLIVTGKGRRAREARPWSEVDGEGVLRQALPRWLNEPANRAAVLALMPARPKDGGDGAFYLLLRRRRDGPA
jgi:DNA-nicking Smr family endonuclease